MVLTVQALIFVSAVISGGAAADNDHQAPFGNHSSSVSVGASTAPALPLSM